MISFGQEFLFEPNNSAVAYIFLTKPYFQNPTINSMTIMWIVNLASYGYLEFRETEILAKGLEKLKMNSLMHAISK